MVWDKDKFIVQVKQKEELISNSYQQAGIQPPPEQLTFILHHIFLERHIP